MQCVCHNGVQGTSPLLGLGAKPQGSRGIGDSVPKVLRSFTQALVSYFPLRAFCTALRALYFFQRSLISLPLFL